MKIYNYPQPLPHGFEHNCTGRHRNVEEAILPVIGILANMSHLRIRLHPEIPSSSEPIIMAVGEV